MKNLSNLKLRKNSKFILGFFSALNILLNFVNQWYIVTEIGPGIETDAYYAALVIPSLFIVVISGAFDKVIVPILVEQKEDFSIYSWTFVTIDLFIFFGLALSLSLTSFFWVQIMFPGFGQEAIDQVINLIYILSFNMALHSVAAVLWSINYAREQFVRVEVVEIFSTMISVIFLFYFLPKYGIIVAAAALVVKMVIQVALLSPALGKFKGFKFKSSVVQEAIKRLKPLVLGSIYYKSDEIVNKFLASLAAPGSITLLHLAIKIYKSANQVINKTFINPAFAKMSKKISVANTGEYQKVFSKTIIAILIITISILALEIVIGNSVLDVIFGYKNFDSNQIKRLWYILLGLSGIWIGSNLGGVLTSAFYAHKNTSTPTKIGIFGFTVGIITKVIGFQFFDIIGLAIGTSLYFLLNVLLLKYFLNKQGYIYE